MRHQWFIVAALLLPLTVFGQNDTVRTLRTATTPVRTEVSEQSYYMDETPEAKQTPDSMTRVKVTTITYYTDTLIEVAFVPDSTAQQRIDTIRPDSTDRRGHYIEAHVGLGYGSMGYKLNGDANSVNGSFSALLQLQYAYFFHPNWGIGAGLWFTNYTSIARIGGQYQWMDQTDTDLEQHYDHTATVHRWRERETIHNLGIPISVQFQYMKEDWKARIFAAVGIAPSFAVSKKYRVLEGEIAHSGYYPNWKLGLDNMHEFATKQYTDQPCAKGTMSVRPQVDIFADFGALVPMTKQVDLFLGGYFNCALNEANSSAKKPLGWRDETFTFMEEYNGAYATDLATASHPWEAGVKIGVHWHYIAPDKHETVNYFDYFTRQDTIVHLIARNDTVVTERVDTLARVRIAKAAKQVEKFNKIFFSLDSYTLTNKAKRYLSSIVGILNQVPEAKVSIDGHASEEGDRAHNEELAYNRAKVVANYLISQGLDKDRVIVLGHGSLIPNEENVGRELRLDRRTEVKVIQDENDIQ